MFIEIDKKRTEFPFGEAVLWLRFDNRALLSIEKAGFNPFDTRVISDSASAARIFISEGLRDCTEKLGASERMAEITNALMSDNSERITELIQRAILEALPADVFTAKSNGGARGNAGILLSAYCDIMHKPEEEFWSSTLREVTERWERYAILKGYKKAPIQIKRFDD